MESKQNLVNFLTKCRHMVKSELIPYLSYKEILILAILNKQSFNFLFDPKEEKYIRHIINVRERNRLQNKNPTIYGSQVFSI